MNPAVAYLVLARGSGPDQRTTSWSVHAIEERTSVARPRAKKAIESLERASLVRITQRGTRPRYYIVPAHEVPGCEGYPPPALDSVEQKVFDWLAAGHHYVPKSIGNSRSYSGLTAAEELESRNWGTWWPRQIADQLVRKGRARHTGGGTYVPICYDAEAAAKPDWIWLPNALVDGAGDNLVPPLELVRQTQNPAALRLLIDLYHAQELASDGGIHWRSVRQSFVRHVVGQRGPYVVYGFSPDEEQAWADKPFVRAHMTGEMDEGADGKQDRGWRVFWTAWNELIRLGLVELVGHVVEADTDQAEVMHPYAVGNGEPAERRIARAAHQAGLAMLTAGQQQWAEDRGLRLVPVRAHITGAQMVGIARLRYRPRTSATAAWFARMPEWDEMAARLTELALTEARGARPRLDMQHQGASR
ncbi:MAG TPA: hypothetical protein VJ779_04145 [Acetobacteraceae bacterium]|nr:hypothetical protein [Acetobacteraceae bacterium]